MPTGEAGLRIRGPGRAVPGSRSPHAADQARSGPQQPGTVYRTAPGHASDPASGNTGTGSDLGFEWQVLGSNQRSLSRPFYSPLSFYRVKRR
jgi:hypothetical protein